MDWGFTFSCLSDETFWLPDASEMNLIQHDYMLYNSTAYHQEDDLLSILNSKQLQWRFMSSFYFTLSCYKPISSKCFRFPGPRSLAADFIPHQLQKKLQRLFILDCPRYFQINTVDRMSWIPLRSVKIFICKNWFWWDIVHNNDNDNDDDDDENRNDRDDDDDNNNDIIITIVMMTMIKMMFTLFW